MESPVSEPVVRPTASASIDPQPLSAGGETAERFNNRELSWLRFNERVLEEALNRDNPLLERVFFLSIFASNLDEFFMIRVSGLRRQVSTGVIEAPPDGMSPVEQLGAIRGQLLPLLERSQTVWRDDLMPRLQQAGIDILAYDRLRARQKDLLRRHFIKEIFPILTPLAFDPSHPFPHISNLSINLAVVVREDGEERFARLKVPQSLSRLLRIPDEAAAEHAERLGLIGGNDHEAIFVWTEEVIQANLDLLFPGVEVVDAHPFRITRDADLEIEEDEAADLLTTMTEHVSRRHFGFAVRLEIDRDMPDHIRSILEENLGLAPYQVFRSRGPLGLSGLSQLTDLERPQLKWTPFQPVVQKGLGPENDLFATLRRHNVLLYHPYDSFTPVVDLLRQAAEDPDVLAIKQALYRVGPNSPIVHALKKARENNKQVSVLVELKARFDEENNISWAQELEKAGVHVVYGVLGLKTHAKICLVVRRERDQLRRYVHLSTGNYNPITARAYTDIGYFTTDEDLADDVSDLFNAITGYSRKDLYRKLLVAPGKMRELMLERITREIKHHREHGDGHIAFKMNSLVDKRCIMALYHASQAGVRIDLQIRGICGLRPGIPGLSETVTVTSVVGRFLEHTRIFYFRNGGGEDEEVIIGSADLMPRNLDKRVESLFPILDQRLKTALRDVLFLHLRDNQKSWLLLPDGRYVKNEPQEGEPAVNSQQRLLEAESGVASWRLEGTTT
ncbi:MAG: polyphosphate kinase 1 [Acidobacteriota bacterium]